MRYLLLATALLLSACASQLKPDPVPGAMDSGYPSAELLACGRRSVGLAVCGIEEGKDLSTLGVSIQAYYKGTVRIDSEACGIHRAYRYDNSQVVKAPLSGPASQSCAIDFVLSPEYPKENTSGLVIESIKGRVWIRVIPRGTAGTHFSKNTKIQQGLNATFGIPYPVNEDVRVVFRGCGTTFDKQLKVKNGVVSVKLHDLRNMFQVEDCIFEGAVLGSKTVRATWQVWSYSDRFTPLAIPATKIENGWLTVNADEAVSIIALDEKYEISNKTHFQFDASKPHVLRMATIGGRIMVGEWNGGWIWKY